MMRFIRTGALLSALACTPLLGWGSAHAAKAVECGGAAMAGGALLSCNHVDKTAPAQFCTFSWTLESTSGSASVAQGNFTIAPGTTNLMVYQGFGVTSALSPPIVMCQGRKWTKPK